MYNFDDWEFTKLDEKPLFFDEEGLAKIVGFPFNRVERNYTITDSIFILGKKKLKGTALINDEKGIGILIYKRRKEADVNFFRTSNDTSIYYDGTLIAKIKHFLNGKS